MTGLCKRRADSLKEDPHWLVPLRSPPTPHPLSKDLHKDISCVISLWGFDSLCAVCLSFNINLHATNHEKSRPTDRFIDQQINIKESLQHMHNNLCDFIPKAGKTTAQTPTPCQWSSLVTCRSLVQSTRASSPDTAGPPWSTSQVALCWASDQCWGGFSWQWGACHPVSSWSAPSQSPCFTPKYLPKNVPSPDISGFRHEHWLLHLPWGCGEVEYGSGISSLQGRVVYEKDLPTKIITWSSYIWQE